MIYYYTYKTPLGWMTLGCIDEALVLCQFGQIDIKHGIHQETLFLQKASQQLYEYFQKKRTSFDLDYQFLSGTPFQKKVWRSLLDIPYGKVVSYQHIAEAVNSPRACRAVGGANHHNPIAIFIPCHRVIGSNKKLVGYGGGLDKKIYLLNLEGYSDFKE